MFVGYRVTEAALLYLQFALAAVPFGFSDTNFIKQPNYNISMYVCQIIQLCFNSIFSIYRQVWPSIVKDLKMVPT
jgi:hypothetical protein